MAKHKSYGYITEKNNRIGKKRWERFAERKKKARVQRKRGERNKERSVERAHVYGRKGRAYVKRCE